MPEREALIEEAEREEEGHETEEAAAFSSAGPAHVEAAAQTPVLPAGTAGPGARPATATEQAMGVAPTADPGGAQAAPLFGLGGKGKTKKQKYKAKNWTAEAIRILLLRYGASDVIETIGSADSSPADVKSAHDLIVAAGKWAGITAALPVGTNLARNTRPALYHIIESNAVDLTECKRLFNLRFQHAAMDTASASWTYDQLRLVWHQLESLPDTDVTRNTALTTFQAISGTGAFGPSWEAPGTVNTIQIGQSRSADAIPHAVRHEVGHAVHTEIPGPINQWLQSEVNVWFETGNAAGVETWLNNIVDFPKDWKDSAGTKKPFTAAEKTKVVAMVTSFLGGGSSWSPSRATVDAGQPADDAALWNSMPHAMQNACTQSKSYWYSNWRNFQKGKDGKKYFLNYWYSRPFHFGTTADKIISATGDDYTAMSEKEFFANCYAEYFENPEGLNDAKKWGGKLPADVKSFFAQMIVNREPYKSAKDRKKMT